MLKKRLFLINQLSINNTLMNNKPHNNQEKFQMKGMVKDLKSKHNKTSINAIRIKIL